MSQYLVVSFLVVAVSSHIVIPASFFGNGNPYVNGSIPSFHGNESIQIGITPYEIGRSFIYGSVYDQIWMNNTIINFSNFSFFHDDFLLSIMERNFVRRPFQPVASLGIGGGSSLVRQFESVDFIRQDNETGYVVLNSSVDWLSQNNCAPDTLMNVPTISEYSRIDQIEVSIGFDFEANLTALFFQITNNKFLLTLPELFFNTLMSILRRHATIVYNSGDSVIFTFCDEVVSSLPDLILAVPNGFIRLAPTDYVRDLGNRSCEFLIGPRSASSVLDAYVFNPFLLTDINLRFTSSHIWFCDTIATNETVRHCS